MDLKLNASRCFSGTHATVRFSKETLVTSGSRVKRVVTKAMSKWRKTLWPSMKGRMNTLSRRKDLKLNAAKYGRNCQFRQSDAEEAPSTKSQKESAKGSVALLKEKVQIGCVSQDSDPKKSIPRKVGKIGIESISGTQREILRRHLAQNFKFGKEKSHLEESSQSVSLIKRNPCAPRLRTDHRRKPQGNRVGPATQDVAINIYKLKK